MALAIVSFVFSGMLMSQLNYILSFTLAQLGCKLFQGVDSATCCTGCGGLSSDVTQPLVGRHDKLSQILDLLPISTP